MSLGKQNWQTRNSVIAPDGVIRPTWWLSDCGGLTWLSVNQKLPSEPCVISAGFPFAVGIRNCFSVPIGAACASDTIRSAMPTASSAALDLLDIDYPLLDEHGTKPRAGGTRGFLREPGRVVPAEDVGDDGDEDPEPRHPQEEDEHRPHQIEKRVVGCEHWPSFLA